MIRKRTRQPEAVEAEPIEDQAAEIETVPDDLAAAAEQMRREAGEARERAARDRARAQNLVSAARAAAAKIIAEAGAEARTLIAGGPDAERAAAALEERARLLTAAAERKAQGEAALQRASALVEEREGIIAQVADLDRQAGQCTAERHGTEAKLTEAREAGDLDMMTSLRNRISSADDLVADLTRRRAAVQARLDQIGDGTVNLPGELDRAIRDARGNLSAAEKALNTAYPGRPEAVAARAWEEFQAVLEANMERLTEEATAKPGQPHRTVML